MKSLREQIVLVLLLAGLTLPLLAQRDVTVDIGDVSYPAYTPDVLVPIILANPLEAVAGLQLDLVIDPAMIELSDVVPFGAAAAFTASYNALTDSSFRIILYNGGGTGTIPVNADTVMMLNFNGSNIVSAVVNLLVSNLVVSDSSGAQITVTGSDGSISIGHVVGLALTDTTADVNDTVAVAVNLNNTGVVGGCQFDLFHTPNFITFLSASPTDRTPGFSVSTAPVMGGGTRIIVYHDGNVNIGAGDGAIVELFYTINSDAYNEDVSINFANVVVSDSIGGVYWIAGLAPGTVTVFPGYLEEPHNLTAVSGLDAAIPVSWDPPHGPIPPEFSEDFESGQIPDDWTMTTNSAVGWFVTQDGSSTYWSIPPHTWYACSNDDAADDDGSMDYLIMPPFNTQGATNITLTFESFFTAEYSQTAHLEVSTDGTNFTSVRDLVGATEWITESIDLSAYTGLASLYIAYHSNDNGAWASGWAIDDVMLTFTVNNVTRNVHFDWSDLGQWVLSSDKETLINRFPQGVPYVKMVDFSEPLTPADVNTTRDIPLTGYNIYRSTTSGSGYTLLDAVGTDVTTYTDEAVENGITYYYIVKADYNPYGESNSSNEASATPVEWVELALSDGSALSGFTDTLDIFLNNESDVSFFYFEINDAPDYLLAESILPTPRTGTGFNLDIVELPSGRMAITGMSSGGAVTPGSESICRVVVRAASQEPATVTLDFTTAQVNDAFGNQMQWTAAGATFDITVETQTIMIGGAVGMPGETVAIPVMLYNTLNIHGIQFTITDIPDNLTGVAVTPTGQVDLSNWTVDGNDVNHQYRVIAFDNTLTNPITPGIYHLADIWFTISAGVPNGIVSLNLSEVIISDVNSIPMYNEIHIGKISVGYPDVVFSIEELVPAGPGGSGSYKVYIQNMVPVYAVILDMFDMPDFLDITSITPDGEFSDGFVDVDNSGEQSDGTGHVVAFDPATGVAPGYGPALTVNVAVSPNAPVNSRIMLMLFNTLASDQVGGALTAMSVGIGQFEVQAATSLETFQPDRFALHPNYPNPFNPSTTIWYDLAEPSRVTLKVYDMIGREVKTLVNTTQDPGRKFVQWDGTDRYGHTVSAGIYLVRIQANQNTAVRKLILIK